ncbi:hypothetical protein F7U82_25075 [Vibrio parahaemolyticus]|nr:hypothetical protein [Vibrio parahaemolyticus]EGQ9308689.1 hypothetical protein [Vibrio parahaemolyticus]EHH2556955.1 hypothetical protein [Vibrio parahaemolyticus]EHK2857725.1 hypothetical protein [Vibrio parahaemolyticus]EIO5874535.1 hypothetical protein [Vibrio parahaemolyticus]EIU7737145.1 hypothetical protein [Vibrio parahaemolyticus]
MLETKSDEMKKIEQDVLSSIEQQMKAYQFAEVNMIVKHRMLRALSIMLLIISVLVIMVPYYPLDLPHYMELSPFVGVVLMLVSVIVFLSDIILFSERSRTELKVLNNKVSSLYDSYRLQDLNLWDLKIGIENVIDFYIKNGKNVFLNYSRYQRRV